MVPKLSIVTPSYNQGQYLEETINSVLNQNYPNLEYIIIDGGSTDGSVEIIKKYEERLHYWCSEPDDGMYDAINKGFSKSTGEIMAWINSDDIYFPWTLRSIGRIFDTYKPIEWVSSLNPGLIDSEGNFIGYFPIPGFSIDAFLDSQYCYEDGSHFMGWIQQESTFWRRTLWDKTGSEINTNIKYAGDFDLWCKFYIDAELLGTSIPLACFRRHREQLTSLNLELYRNDAIQLLDNLRKLFKWQPTLMFKIISQLNLVNILNYAFLRSLLFRYQGRKIVVTSGQEGSQNYLIKNYQFS